MSESPAHVSLDSVTRACRLALQASYSFLEFVSRSLPNDELVNNSLGWQVPYSKRQVAEQTARFLGLAKQVDKLLESVDGSLEGPWGRLAAVGFGQSHCKVLATSMSQWSVALMAAMRDELAAATYVDEIIPSFTEIEDQAPQLEEDELSTKCASSWKLVRALLDQRFADRPSRDHVEQSILREDALVRHGQSGPLTLPLDGTPLGPNQSGHEKQAVEPKWTNGHLGLRYDESRLVVGREGYSTELSLADRPLLRRLFAVLFQSGERPVTVATLRRAWEDQAPRPGRDELLVDDGNIYDAMYVLRKALAPLAVMPKVARLTGYRLVEIMPSTKSANATEED